MAIISSFFHFSSQNDVFASIPYTVCFVFAIFCFTWMYQKSKRGSSPLPPGPRGIPLLGSLPFLNPELHTYFTSLAQTYGPIFKLQLGIKTNVIVSSSSLARQLLKDNDIAVANRELLCVAREVSYGGHDVTFNEYGAEWKMLRKICVVQMLNNTTLDSFYSLRRSEIRKTIGYIYSQAGSAINVGEQMFLTTLNVITNMVWGGTILGDERAKIGAEFYRVVSEINCLLGKPDISDFYPSLARFDLQGSVKRIKGLSMKLDDLFDRIIDQRLKYVQENQKDIDIITKKNKDFLQFLLQLKAEENSNPPLTMTHVKCLLLDMVMAGTETTSITIEFALTELMKKPEAMKKLRKEIDDVVGKDNIVEESHIHKLPYLRAIMKETLRLHPPVPLLPRRPKETIIIGGYTIPKDVPIFLNIWAIQRDPSVWQNPLEFIPERFLVDNWDNNGNDLNYFPFGSGRRLCVGIGMAERMFMHAFATIIHSFDWTLPKGTKLDQSERYGFVMKMKNPFVAIPTPRLSDPTLYD